MQLPRWAVGLVVAVIATLVIAVTFLLGRNFQPGATDKPGTAAQSEDPAAAARGAIPAGALSRLLGTPPATVADTPPAIPEAAVRQQALVGIWALADTGCATGYGAAYTPDGRFAEGDEYMGEEGRWSVEGDAIVRQITQSFERSDETASPVVKAMDRTDRIAIAGLDGDKLTIRTDKGAFAYIKCPEGRHAFIDGSTFP